MDFETGLFSCATPNRGAVSSVFGGGLTWVSRPKGTPGGQVGSVPEGFVIDAFYASPMQRVQQTLEAVIRAQIARSPFLTVCVKWIRFLDWIAGKKYLNNQDKRV